MTLEGERLLSYLGECGGEWSGERSWGGAGVRRPALVRLVWPRGASRDAPVW